MPLTLVRAPDTGTLWTTCARRFLDQLGGNPGPSEFTSHLWVAQESQLDLLYEAAFVRGLRGWLGPPASRLRDLPNRFEIRDRRLGLLTRRRLISRIASHEAREAGMRDPSRSDGVVRGHMLDALFGELLPEGVTPEALAEALRVATAVVGDDFAHRRNRWIVGSYAAYLGELRARDRIDARQTNALVAAAIESGGLHSALRGAGALHVYGLYMRRSRQRLLDALAGQAEVDVRLYVLTPAADDPEPSEWDGLGLAVEDLGGESRPAPRVQPAPDTQRETEWVARQVKRLLAEQQVEPHRIAVVARSGRDDTGRIHRALRDAGVTATTLVRARLTEIAALKALLALFRGAARNWTYRTLRPVLDNTLFDIKIDLRTIDFVAHDRRVEGLESWEREIERLIVRLEDTHESGMPRDRGVRGKGLWPDAVRRDLLAFRAVRTALEPLAAARTEGEWIELALALLRDEQPAAFSLRRRLCDPVGRASDRDGAESSSSVLSAQDARDARRWDVVRLDQRGVRQTENLLREWLDLDHPAEPLDPEAWRQLLTRMLEANELSITTPGHKGVQVLEAHDAALLPFEHVFVVHANDGVFPRTIPAGGVVSNDERARLRDAGVPLSWRELDLQRERALWRAVTAAGEVAVSYRTADPGGTPLLPSLLVPEHDDADALPRVRTRYESETENFVPVTAAQADQRAAVELHDTLAGTGSRPEAGQRATGEAATALASRALHPGSPELIAHAVLAAVAESHRDTGAVTLAPDSPAYRPNPWNGWLRDPRVLERLGERFAADYPWSASGLEAYSRLPFQFLLDRVLRYEEATEAEEEVTPLVFGSAAHDLLEKFYSRLLSDLPVEFDARADTAFEEAAAEVIAAAQAGDEWHGDEVLWTQEWQKIRDRVRAYLEWELPFINGKGERPELIEHGFGFGDERVHVEGKDVAGRVARLRLCGRIDRVDRGKGGYQVLDYKSGWTPGANDYLDGTALQAPLYMQVLENGGHQVSLGYYRSLKQSKKPTQYAGKIKRADDRYDDALRFALSIPGRIRAGLFEPVISTKSKGWAAWFAGRDIARSKARLPEGNRYENLEPLQPEPGPAAAPGRDPNETTAATEATSATETTAATEAPVTAPPADLDPPRLPFDTGGEDA